MAPPPSRSHIPVAPHVISSQILWANSLAQLTTGTNVVNGFSPSRISQLLSPPSSSTSFTLSHNSSHWLGSSGAPILPMNLFSANLGTESVLTVVLEGPLPECWTVLPENARRLRTKRFMRRFGRLEKGWSVNWVGKAGWMMDLHCKKRGYNCWGFRCCIRELYCYSNCNAWDYKERQLTDPGMTEPWNEP